MPLKVGVYCLLLPGPHVLDSCPDGRIPLSVVAVCWDNCSRAVKQKEEKNTSSPFP